MASFLSEDWIAEFAEGAALLPGRPGLDGVVRFAISKTPHGKVQFRLVVADGRVVEVLPGRDGNQDATVTWAYPDAVAQFRGEFRRNLGNAALVIALHHDACLGFGAAVSDQDAAPTRELGFDGRER